ncbi:MAG: RNA methyltransferase [Candidatus Omnitrophota bacterium]
MKIYGKRSVLERIRVNPGTIKKIYLQKRVDLSEIVKALKEKCISFESVDNEWIKTKCGEVNVQGVVAEVSLFEYASFSQIIKECSTGASIPVFIDSITDPQNLGSIIRNVACLGGFSIVLPEHRSVCVNETVLRVACGGENYLKISKVTNLAGAVRQAKEKGVMMIGADVQGHEDVSKIRTDIPIGVVIGSEGKGIRPGLAKLLDVKAVLPMHGAPLSYNAAVAATLFCYEVRRNR